MTDLYAALLAATSPAEFGSSMAQLAKLAGAEHFLAIRLVGLDYTDIAQTLHNGTQAAAERIDEARHWTIERMVESMRSHRPPIPKVFGTAAELGLDVAGYQHGVAAIATRDRAALVVYFGRPGPPVVEAELFELMSTAQMSAIHGLDCLATMPVSACPLRERELQCLRLYQAGATKDQSAKALGIAPRTVEGHLSLARARCGVRTTSAAAQVALNQGWITAAEIAAVRQAS